MAQQLLFLGTTQNDGTGTTGRAGGEIINDNFTDLYATRAQIQYVSITTATRAILDSELVLGHNIFGVNYAGAVAITVPANIDSNKLVMIKDESGSAGANNITVAVV